MDKIVILGKEKGCGVGDEKPSLSMLGSSNQCLSFGSKLETNVMIEVLKLNKVIYRSIEVGEGESSNHLAIKFTNLNLFNLNCIKSR
jgi:hypothetical protein